jgi:plastocyanin
MINEFSEIPKNSIYLILSIILLSSCTSSSIKVSKEYVSDSNGSKVETSVIDKGVPHVYTISISDMKFHPEIIEVNKGDTVVWVNNDLVVHCVTEIPGGKWTSSKLHPGESWKIAVFASSEYDCAIHPIMKGRIDVR